MLLAGGTPAFAAAIGVHLAVGYTSAMHLAPAFAALLVFAAALALLRAWLCQPEEERAREWRLLETGPGGAGWAIRPPPPPSPGTPPR